MSGPMKFNFVVRGPLDAAMLRWGESRTKQSKSSRLAVASSFLPAR